MVKKTEITLTTHWDDGVAQEQKFTLPGSKDGAPGPSIRGPKGDPGAPGADGVWAVEYVDIPLILDKPVRTGIAATNQKVNANLYIADMYSLGRPYADVDRVHITSQLLTPPNAGIGGHTMSAYTIATTLIPGGDDGQDLVAFTQIVLGPNREVTPATIARNYLEKGHAGTHSYALWCKDTSGLKDVFTSSEHNGTLWYRLVYNVLKPWETM